ncbi:DUF397 domain-containing protein [Streptomyces sp. NPDC048295]|uniref:DUF397 domain-containing protein n=1 Tax=Streptomyces sp. NPDC048295 TaxID=3154617 RepID=UPI00341F8A78
MTVFRFSKSSYSATSSECVEVACNVPHTIAVRDSKRPDSPVIVLGPAAWDAFRAGLVRSSG